MGHMIEAVLAEQHIECPLVTNDICSIDPDVARHCICIDFSTPKAFRDNYRFIASHFKGAVVGTTGWDDIKQQVIECFEQHGCTLVYSSNFSIGVNLLFAAVDFLSRKIAATGGYSPYILEMHHSHKLDAPSGTAKTLQGIVDGNMHTHSDVQAIRCGEIPGIHIVGFEGVDDRLKIAHEAFSRRGFAQGAVAAATKADTLTGTYDFKYIIFDN